MIERVIAEHELARPVMGTIFIVCMMLCYTWSQFVPPSHVMYSKLETLFPIASELMSCSCPSILLTFHLHFLVIFSSTQALILTLLVKEKKIKNEFLRVCQE